MPSSPHCQMEVRPGPEICRENGATIGFALEPTSLGDSFVACTCLLHGGGPSTQRLNGDGEGGGRFRRRFWSKTYFQSSMHFMGKCPAQALSVLQW